MSDVATHLPPAGALLALVAGAALSAAEPAVLDPLVAEDGASHCVVASWKDDRPLDAERPVTPCRGLLRALRQADAAE